MTILDYQYVYESGFLHCKFCVKIKYSLFSLCSLRATISEVIFKKLPMLLFLLLVTLPNKSKLYDMQKKILLLLLSIFIQMRTH